MLFFIQTYGRLYLAILMLLNSGCGFSSIIITPNYESDLLKPGDLKRENVRIVEVVDNRGCSPKEIGTGHSDFDYSDVKYSLSVDVSGFLHQVLDSLIVIKNDNTNTLPITVNIDIFQVGKQRATLAEMGYFMCKLRFTFPTSQDSIAEVSVRSEMAKYGIDATSSFEDLIYKGTVDCARKFVIETLDKRNELIKR